MTVMDRTPVPRNLAFGGVRVSLSLIFRSLALFVILCQFRLIAADLADTPVFVAALFASFAAALVLAGLSAGGRKAGPLAALAAIGLIPWATRACIALPRLFIPGGTGALAITLDSLLLNLDRNNFVSLLPFYWAAATSWFSIRSRTFLRAAVIADAALLVVVFSIVRAASIPMYRWPVVMIAVFAGIVFAQALALLFSLPPETRLRKGEAAGAAAAILALILIGGILFLKPSQERAVEKGGGLLEPKLFSFDFSQFLRLDSEISMNDDLVLIVKKDGDDDHILLRRSVLSGYSRKQGFYRIEELDERTHPQRLPERPLSLAGRRPAASAVKAARQVSQEYFLVNFDAAAFIGMNEPQSVTPYESWDASSFSSAYAVESMVSGAGFQELSRSTLEWPGAAELGLSDDEFAIYTDYGGDGRIRAYAEEITRGLDRYADKVRMIHNRLKYGEYRYSLKPGIAPDGDQLAWFLFQSKKGYCSYYAFAMALLLRSLGIPARVAAGFFIEPNTNAFNYYPVRSDMAHAWVEVPFPGYGWIEYDPTAEYLAEGEDFRFSEGVDPNLFERLMREILENRSRLRAKEGQDQAAAASGIGSFARKAALLLRAYSPPLLLLVIAALFVHIRCGCLLVSVMRREKRKQAAGLWKHALRRLRLAGYRRSAAQSEAEWALDTDRRVAGVYAMYQIAAAARFAPVFSDNDFALQQRAYRTFSAAYGKTVSPWRRLAAWIAPPLALVLGPGKGGGTGRSADKAPAALLLLLVFLALGGSETGAQNGEDAFSAADELYMDATEAKFAEFWERAIELFKEGNARYPDDPRFPWALGNLYYSRSFYALAWDEYRKAEAISPFDTDILLRLANTAGYLNRDQTSIQYYERILALDPDHKEAIGSLGWMYYKAHRLKEGEQLLGAALERFGDDPDLAMTLGTVYSDMYHYNDGKYWYEKAIAGGEALGDRLFTAVVWYNLSILETRFYRFARAMDATNASLHAQNRASGRLARGELYLRQLDLARAQKDYEAAYETDTSPLAKLNLAQVYQISGRLEEARLYAEDCLKRDDLSWMLHYGIDPDRYKRDIHEILYKTYEGLANTERFMPWGLAGEKIRSWFRGVSFRFKSAVHRRLYRKYSLAAADAYGAEIYKGRESLPLDAFIQYYNAFETYPRRARVYLNKARDMESSLIPEAAPSYDLEEGRLLRNKGMLEQALAGLDPLWERELVSQCYREFARRGGSAPARQAAEELFALNRGALRQAGIGLPADIRLSFSGEAGARAFRRSEQALRKALEKAGFQPAGGGPGSPARFSLSIRIHDSTVTGYTASCELVDSVGAGKTLRYSIPLRSLSAANIAGFAGGLGGMVFRAE
jgi:Tfp pilus assembly protein PilF